MPMVCTQSIQQNVMTEVIVRSRMLTSVTDVTRGFFDFFFFWSDDGVEFSRAVMVKLAVD